MTLKETQYDVIVVGAGMAGLTTAFMLKKSGYNVAILEKNKHSGGVVQSERINDFLCEYGPNTFLPTAKPLLHLINKLGLDDQLIFNTPCTNHRYIFSHGRLREMHMHPFKFLTSSLLSWRGKLRLLWEPFAKGVDNERDESIAEFIERRLGSDILDTLIDPMVTGIVAGDPRQLSMAATFPKLVGMERQYGSLFRALRAKSKAKAKHNRQTLFSFINGLQTLPNALTAQLAAHVHHDIRIDAIRENSPRHYTLQMTQGTQQHQITAPALVCATPAYSAAPLMSRLLPEITEPLSAIPYAPVAVVHTGYRNNHAQLPAGFGFLVPRREGVRLLGSIFSSQIFPNRAPSGYNLLTNMVGGATDSNILDLSDTELLEIVRDDLKKTLQIDNAPAFSHIKRHTKAIPQYVIGHQRRIDWIHTTLKTKPGLYCTGNYLSGYSLADTIANATAVATETAEYLTAHKLA